MNTQPRLATGPIKDQPLWLTSGRIARRFDRTTRTIERWIAAGLFPPPDLKVRDIRYWHPQTVEKFEADQRAAT